MNCDAHRIELVGAASYSFPWPFPLQVKKNQLLLSQLDAKLPSDSSSPLSASDIRQLVRKFSFAKVEIFRKYIRYSLVERPFEPKVGW